MGGGGEEPSRSRTRQQHSQSLKTGGPREMTQLDPQFTAWYRLVDPEPKPDILASRQSAVRAVTKEARPEFVLETVRMALGRETRGPEFVDGFRLKLQEADASIPAVDNKMELAVLACATWASVLKKQDQ